MRLYLDDDAVSGLLIRLLNNVGHDIEIPADAVLSGEDDPLHLTSAVEVKAAYFFLAITMISENFTTSSFELAVSILAF